MEKQCTQPKRRRSSAWFKEKLMLVEEQEAGQILDEEQLAFIADPGIAEVQVAQQIISQNSAFQTEDLDTYDSDCDDISSAKAVLMENLSSCNSDVLSEVLYSDTYLNDMINQDVQEMSYSEQTHIVDFPDNEITSDSNIIPYSQYLQESQDAEHDVISVIDDEETLILEEESRSKMLDRQNDPISIKQKINISPIDYSKLNKILEDFGKHFVTKKELSAEQAFWLKHSNYNPDTSVKSHTPVRIEAPSKLPKVSLVNESLKKLKYHLASFDTIVKKRTTSDAISADILNVNKSCVDECNKCLEVFLYDSTFHKESKHIKNSKNEAITRKL
ncbi:hypothetical protein Tco_0255525 [Tanacetum coccineum]